MSTCSFLLNQLPIKEYRPQISKPGTFLFSKRYKPSVNKHGKLLCYMKLGAFSTAKFPHFDGPLDDNVVKLHTSLSNGFLLADLDPATAKLGIGILGPALSAFGFLFVVRIVMSWYPNLPTEKFPYVLAYAPTEPILALTRKVIPPLGGVDVTPVVWFGLVSFLNEILVGPQGLLVLLSQQIN